MPILYSKVTTEPAVEPISLTQAKAHLHVDHTDEDDMISFIIQSARENIEQMTNRSLINQTKTLKLHYFPVSIYNKWGEILLPCGPVSSVTSVYYYNESEANTLLSSSDYWVDTTSNIPKIIIKDSWPATFDMPNAVTITYVAGYGATGSTVPKALMSAMYLMIGHLYENREQVGDIKHELPFGMDYLLAPYILEHPINY